MEKAGTKVGSDQLGSTINFIFSFVNFNDTLVSSTHTRPVSIFNLEGGETMLARDKGNFHAPGENRTRDPPVQRLENPIFRVF